MDMNPRLATIVVCVTIVLVLGLVWVLR